MKLEDIETIGNEEDYEVAISHTINFREVFNKLLALCDKYNSYAAAARNELMDILLATAPYEEAVHIVKERCYSIADGYTYWLIVNWNTLKTSEDISERTKKMIQKYIDKRKSNFLL